MSPPPRSHIWRDTSYVSCCKDSFLPGTIWPPTYIWKLTGGVAMVLWKNGRLLVWDATSPDTCALSYSSSSTSEAGAVASLGAEEESKVYQLRAKLLLYPRAVWCLWSTELLNSSGNWVTTMDKSLMMTSATSIYLLQRLAVAVQRGNSASVLGSLGHRLPRSFVFFIY